MTRLIGFCAGRPVAVLMVLMAMLLLTLLLLPGLELAWLPRLALPRILVDIAYPGQTAESVRASLVLPLEDSLASLRGMTSMRSLAGDGYCCIVLEFTWGEPLHQLSGRVREAVDLVYSRLPAAVEKPRIMVYEPEREPLLIFTLDGQAMDGLALRHLAECELKAQLRALPALSAIEVSGGHQPELRLLLDLEQAMNRRVDLGELSRVLSDSILDLPIGSLRDGQLRTLAMAKGRPEDLAGLGGLWLPVGGQALLLSSLAELELGTANADSLFLHGGREVVALLVFSRSGVNPLHAAREAQTAIDRLLAGLGGQVRSTTIFNAASALSAAIHQLAWAAAAGCLAAALVLFAFLPRRWTGILVALTIPLSLAPVLVVLRLTGRSINSMSLGGMALAVGMISDTAVIVLDALCRDCVQDEAKTGGRPEPDRLALCLRPVLGGTLGSTMTTVVVFCPLFILPGLLGALFADLALAVLVAVLAAWLLAVFALPAIYRLCLPLAEAGGRRLAKPRTGWYQAMRLEEAYRRALRWAGLHRWLGRGLAALLAMVGLVVLLRLPAGFLPARQLDRVELSLDFPTGTSIEGMADAGRSLQQHLLALPSVLDSYAMAGAEPGDLRRRADPDWRAERLLFHCQLAPGCDPVSWSAQAAGLLEPVLPPGCSLRLEVARPALARLLGLDQPPGYRLHADSPDELALAAARLETRLAAELGSVFFGLDRQAEPRSLQLYLRPQRDSLAALGLEPNRLVQQLRLLNGGLDLGSLELDGRQVALRLLAGLPTSLAGGVSAMPAAVQEPMALASASILLGQPLAAERGYVRLAQVLSLDWVEKPAVLLREQRADVLRVRPLVAGGHEPALDRLMAALAASQPGLYRVDPSALRGQAADLARALALVLGLLFFTLCAQFESWRLPPVLLLSIPLTLAGVGPLLALAGLGLDAGVILGLLVLFGVVVNNAILLYEAMLRAGRHSHIDAAVGRLRPILATTATTLVALAPVAALSTDPLQVSLALSLIGGLAASSLLSLFILPGILEGFVPGGKA